MVVVWSVVCLVFRGLGVGGGVGRGGCEGVGGGRGGEGGEEVLGEVELVGGGGLCFAGFGGVGVVGDGF